MTPAEAPTCPFCGSCCRYWCDWNAHPILRMSYRDRVPAASPPQAGFAGDPVSGVTRLSGP
jgi:hypothetical protein